MNLKTTQICLIIILIMVSVVAVIDRAPSSKEYQTFLSESLENNSANDNEFFLNKPCFPVNNLSQLKLTNGSTVNLSEADLRGLDLCTQITLLNNASFSTNTIWSSQLPASFNPALIMERGKTPGWQVKQLHAQGIDGQGVRIAIVGTSRIPTKHVEYQNNLWLYEEINIPNKIDSYDESLIYANTGAVSVAIGKSTGIAPGAQVFYIAENSLTVNNFSVFTSDYQPLASALKRVKTINQQLPKENKIKVVAVLDAIKPWDPGYIEVLAGIEQLKQDGIFVVHQGMISEGYYFSGLERKPRSDPEDFFSYGYSRKVSPRLLKEQILLLPINSRTLASPTGVTDYVFQRNGFLMINHLAIPYIAGLYALICQIYPAITPEFFWQQLLKTGRRISLSDQTDWKGGKMVDPLALINSFKDE